jgi:hypothetical protein
MREAICSSTSHCITDDEVIFRYGRAQLQKRRGKKGMGEAIKGGRKAPPVALHFLKARAVATRHVRSRERWLGFSSFVLFSSCLRCVLSILLASFSALFFFSTFLTFSLFLLNMLHQLSRG